MFRGEVGRALQLRRSIQVRYVILFCVDKGFLNNKKVVATIKELGRQDTPKAHIEALDTPITWEDIHSVITSHFFPSNTFLLLNSSRRTHPWPSDNFRFNSLPGNYIHKLTPKRVIHTT